MSLAEYLLIAVTTCVQFRKVYTTAIVIYVLKTKVNITWKNWHLVLYHVFNSKYLLINYPISMSSNLLAIYIQLIVSAILQLR